MRTLIIAFTLCSVLVMGKDIIDNSVKIQHTHHEELNKALTMLDK